VAGNGFLAQNCPDLWLSEPKGASSRGGRVVVLLF
jgi:hypothetical protein